MFNTVWTFNCQLVPPTYKNLELLQPSLHPIVNTTDATTNYSRTFVGHVLLFVRLTSVVREGATRQSRSTNFVAINRHYVMFLSPISRCSPVVECRCRTTDVDSLFARSMQSLPRSSTARALADVLHCSDPYLLPFCGRPIFDCDVSVIRSTPATTDRGVTPSSPIRSDLSSSSVVDLPGSGLSRPRRITLRYGTGVFLLQGVLYNKEH